MDMGSESSMQASILYALASCERGPGSFRNTVSHAKGLSCDEESLSDFKVQRRWEMYC